MYLSCLMHSVYCTSASKEVKNENSVVTSGQNPCSIDIIIIYDDIS